LESLKDLDANLRKIGSGLLVLFGKPEVELFRVVNQFNAQKIYTKKEVAYEEIQKEETVEKEMEIKLYA
jgi:deoxyribodipyrimidine photo-lyase